MVQFSDVSDNRTQSREGEPSRDKAPSSQDVGNSQQHDDEKEDTSDEEIVAAKASFREHLEKVAAEPLTFVKNSAAAVQIVAPAPQASGDDDPASEEQDECAPADRAVDMVVSPSTSLPHLCLTFALQARRR